MVIICNNSTASTHLATGAFPGVQNALTRCVVDVKVHRGSNWHPIHCRINRVRQLPVHASAHQSLIICRLARFVLKTLAFSLFRGVKQTNGSRAFCIAAPTIFNSLPEDIRSCDSISTIFRLIKTSFYFRDDLIKHWRRPSAPQIQLTFVDIVRVIKLNTYLLTCHCHYSRQTTLCTHR